MKLRLKSAGGVLIALTCLGSVGSAAGACGAPGGEEGQQASGLQVRMTVADLVTSSDLVVLGTLGRITPGAGASGMMSDLGSITVDEVLYTRVKPATAPKTAAILLPSRGGLIASDTVFYSVGQRGVWFLRQAPQSADRYLADGTQRLQPVDVLNEVRRIVKSKSQ